MDGSDFAPEHDEFEMASTSPQTPLGEVRVIDASNLVAGPLSTNLLADFGADVIKIEHPKHGDSLRHLSPHKDDVSLWWKMTARNKRCVTLDLSAREGKEIFEVLVADADVVVENFRPGTMERWGLGYEALKEINPDIVMLRVTGYGQTGPYKDRPGFGRMATAMGGVSHITGEPDGPPLTPGYPLGDTTAALFGVFGILSALYYRDVHDEGGQYIDVGLYEGVFRTLESLPIEYDQLQSVQERTGASHSYSGGSNVYETKDGEHVEITLSTASTWHYLCEAIEREDLIEQFGSTAAERAEHSAEIHRILSEWVGERTRDEVESVFEPHSVPHAFVYDAKDMFNDEHYRARDSLVRVPDEELGEAVVQGIVPKLSETPGEITHLGPKMGEHNEEIYRDELGISAERLEELCEKSVI